MIRQESLERASPAPEQTARLIRVMVVDDHTIVRAGISAMLAREPGMRVVAEASTGGEALQLVEQVKPNVALLDFRLPDMSGAATCREITRLHPQTGVAILTTFVDDEIIASCLAAGARAYLLKDLSATDLMEAIRAVARGESVLSPTVTARVVSWAREGRARFSSGHVTDVEAKVLGLVAEGHSNAQIAERMNVSTHMVKFTLRALMRRLGVRTRSEAAAIAIRKGLI